MRHPTTPFTVNLTQAEIEAVEALSAKRDLSPDGVVRQALRLYQMVDRRLDEGETFTFSGDGPRARAFYPGPDLVAQMEDAPQGELALLPPAPDARD